MQDLLACRILDEEFTLLAAKRVSYRLAPQAV